MRANARSTTVSTKNKVMKTKPTCLQRIGHRLTAQAALGLLLLTGMAQASTFTVNSTGDTGTGSGFAGDLRYCITQANSAGGNETITFDSTVFATHQTIFLNGTQLELSGTTGTIAIIGPANRVTIFGGNSLSRVFQIDAGVTAQIVGLTIEGGTADNGGGIYNLGPALAALNVNDTATACSDVQDFVNQTNAQSGKKIPATTAAMLVKAATQISAALGCL
jgi:hypothetical protein